MKKLWKLFGMFSFVLIVSVLAGMTTYADGYDAAAAVAWAEANYSKQTGNLKCADFASKALNAGGVTNIYSNSSTTLRQLLLNSGMFQEIIPQVASKSSIILVSQNSSIKPGDFIFYQESGKSNYCHVAVICHSGNDGYGNNVWWISQWNPAAHGQWAAGYKKDDSYTYKKDTINYSILHYTGPGPGTGGSSCGCSEANGGYYKVTATDGLSVNSGHNFNSKCGELSYGQVVKVSKASGTGGVSGTYGHIVYNGKECYIAMKYMTRASDSEVCAAVGHNQQTIPGKAASCTASGLTDGVRCTRCGATITSQQTIPAMGHTFGSWRDKSAATCTAQATHVAVCGRCGSEYGSVTPYGDYVQHIQDPNNKEYCKVCGQKCFEEEVQEGVSAWTKADEAPDGVEIVNRKWSYTKREYTTSSNSNLPGWVQYILLSQEFPNTRQEATYQEE